MSSYRRIAHALDPVIFARETLGFVADPWQETLLRTTAMQVILNNSRQSGKSTVTAILALHKAVFVAGSLILLISPSLRQSKELFSKVTNYLKRAANMSESERQAFLQQCRKLDAAPKPPPVETTPRTARDMSEQERAEWFSEHRKKFNQ